jgi:hypothetical protein
MSSAIFMADPNRINLDIGAFARGRLTCVVLGGFEAAISRDSLRVGLPQDHFSVRRMSVTFR